MNYSTNFNLNKPERNEQFNLDDWNNNTDAIDKQMQTNKTNIATNANNISTLLSNLTSNANYADTSSTFYKLFKLIYPVGSLYWSSKNTNPGTLFGGTWTQIKDRFVLACGDTYKTTGATGGASSVTLTVSNMPSHTHTFTPSGTITMNAHSHTIGSHTHTFSGTNTHTHTISHRHIYAFNRDDSNTYDSYTYSTGANTYGNKNTNKSGNFAWTSEPRTGGSTKSLGSEVLNSGSTTISISGTTSSTQPSCSSTTSTGKFTGSSGTTSSNGSGTSFSILPPYIVKYCWERTA